MASDSDNGSAVARVDYAYQLDERYTLSSGRIYLTGSQALVRLPLMQRQRDLAAGLNTAGFISGYTGSPLGGYDLALKQAGHTVDGVDSTVLDRPVRHAPVALRFRQRSERRGETEQPSAASAEA
jgi:hypothetical protein